MAFCGTSSDEGIDPHLSSLLLVLFGQVHLNATSNMQVRRKINQQSCGSPYTPTHSTNNRLSFIATERASNDWLWAIQPILVRSPGGRLLYACSCGTLPAAAVKVQVANTRKSGTKKGRWRFFHWRLAFLEAPLETHGRLRAMAEEALGTLSKELLRPGVEIR